MKKINLFSFTILLLLNTSYKANDTTESTIANKMISIDNDLLFDIVPENLIYNVQYNKVINKIKEHESFVNHKYHTGIDTDNWTIGYGHLIKQNEMFPEIITERFADSLLSCDFNDAMNMAKFHSPKFNDNKYKYQLLAIGHFIYCKGVGHYSRSTLKECVNNNIDIYNELIKWIIIRINGEIIEHPKMLENRNFEYEIYNYQ